MSDSILNDMIDGKYSEASVVNTLVYLEKVIEPDDSDVMYSLHGKTYESVHTQSEEVTIEIMSLPTDDDGNELDSNWEVENWYYFGGLRKLPTSDSLIGDVLFEWDNRGPVLKDDWVYPSERIMRKNTLPRVGSSISNNTSSSSNNTFGSTLAASSHQQSMNDVQTYSSQPNNLGFSVGGEKDGNSFRENILNGNVPQLSALSYEGLFHEYFFDRNDSHDDSKGLFYPSYATASITNPVTDEAEEYMTVGLNSNISKDQFSRLPLNLTVVLDISGSMNHPFKDYYYDEPSKSGREHLKDKKTKIDSAIESLKGLTTHLTEQDSLGIVLFNEDAHIAKPLRDVKDTDLDAIRGHIEELEATGSTNMSAGFKQAKEMLEPVSDDSESESRIILLTDEMPNKGQTTLSELIDTVSLAAEKNIYTSFIGVGLDANPELGSELSNIKGANHYFIKSSDEFKNRLDDEFDYMVTPLVHDLNLSIQSDGYKIKEVYGAPSVDSHTDTVFSVSTLFPSKTEDEQTKGGVILVQLERTDENDTSVSLTASWKERNNSSDKVTKTVNVEREQHYETTGIQKAIALTQYCSSLRTWVKQERSENEGREFTDIIEGRKRTKWEQESVSFTPKYNKELKQIREYLSNTIDEVEDESIEQELNVLDAITSDIDDLIN